MPDSPLATAIRDANVEELASLIGAGAAVSPRTGEALLRMAGDQDRIIETVLADNPWLLELSVVHEGGDKVVRGRVLHVSDRLNPSADEYIRELARLALGCLPDVSRADLTTVWAGGIPARIGDLDIATSGLLQLYALSPVEIAWNRARSQIGRSVVAAESRTGQLCAGLAILERTTDFLAELADSWCTNRGQGAQLDRMNDLRTQLSLDIDALSPKRANPLGPFNQGSGDLGEVMLQNDRSGEVLDDDPIHGVAQAIVQNLAGRIDDPSGYALLAGFAGDTIRARLAQAAMEPWSLLGLDGTPPAISRLDTLLQQLSAVLWELSGGTTAGKEFSAVTGTAPSGSALSRAAKLAIARAANRYRKNAVALKRAAAARGIRVEVRSREDLGVTGGFWPPRATAVVVNLDSLMQIGTANAIIAELIADADLPDNAAVVIPARNGIAIPRYAARIHRAGEIYQFPEAAEAWLDTFPASLPTPLTDAVAAAVSALQELSALAYLEEQRDVLPQAQAAAEEAAVAFRDSFEAIHSLPRDAVTERILTALNELSARLQAEVDGRATTPRFAESVIRGLTEETEDSTTVTAMVLIATEWDIDPQGAVSLLADLLAHNG